MRTTLSTSDLLGYDARYMVLICRECKYAIQNSALGSHLLRHKIYRRERQRLLSSISRLQLLDPDDVQLPPAGSAPVDGLPIISGYRCAATGCGSLCASAKRMKCHWREVHGVCDPSEPFAQPVTLPTFFRGTKLRYFEVASPGSADGGSSIAEVDRPDQQLHPNHGVIKALHTQPSVLARYTTTGLDLETLRYFHHFTTTTCLTLPVASHEDSSYWQTDVVTQALRLHWLMCGLLAISASHLATLSNDKTVKQVHQGQSARFLQEFSAGWEKLKPDSGVVQAQEEVKTAALMMCIHRCCNWISASSLLGPSIVPEQAAFRLQSFTKTIQGCIDVDFALHTIIGSDDAPGEASSPARDDKGQILAADGPRNAPPALIARLRALPFRMAGVLGKPGDALDPFATLSAIEALINYCSLSYESDDARTTWTGMESWIRRLPRHFNHMILRQSPAALIVLAHWTLLVERAERHYWFLKGSAVIIRRQIAKELSADSGIRSLVIDLIS